MQDNTPNNISVISPDVVQAAERVTEKPLRDWHGPYTTSLGVVLKYRKVPSQLVFKAWSSLEVPKVPEVWIDEHGRFEPNPASPGYAEALNNYSHKRVHLTTLIYFMRGLIVDHVPDDVSKVEDDDWFEGIDDVLDIPKRGDARKAAWLMYYAIPEDEEQGMILSDLMILSGMVPEQEVADALESFRDNEGPETNNTSPS